MLGKQETRLNVLIYILGICERERFHFRRVTKMSAPPHSVKFTFSQETYVFEEEKIFSGTSDPDSDFENCDVEEIDL